ncbi:hypothetical protein [uncultured Sulfitobacter sp.]|uniref:hypothetical protein n=1 Tax=uncultured Sulfitobacter sp. TaxID=191468 RepID=UPI002634C7CD|nr:hypothetical protein [uncultured Sulfitobacter sp.]
MSAPDTNIGIQEKRHRPALLGIKGAMLFGALMVIGLLGLNMMNAGDPDAVTNTDQAGTAATAAQTDVYEPGTNSSATPLATD